jgi:hypothetical protein
MLIVPQLSLCLRRRSLEAWRTEVEASYAHTVVQLGTEECLSIQLIIATKAPGCKLVRVIQTPRPILGNI